ncbi:hypothetical protein MRX96_028608 [Rhipicephalus microplus]
MRLCGVSAYIDLRSAILLYDCSTTIAISDEPTSLTCICNCVLCVRVRESPLPSLGWMGDAAGGVVRGDATRPIASTTEVLQMQNPPPADVQVISNDLQGDYIALADLNKKIADCRTGVWGLKQ